MQFTRIARAQEQGGALRRREVLLQRPVERGGWGVGHVKISQIGFAQA